MPAFSERHLALGIVGTAVVVASGLFLWTNFWNGESPRAIKWVDRVEGGFSAPACASACGGGAGTTCLSGAPLVDFVWEDHGNSDDVTCATVKIEANGSLVQSGLPCSDDFPRTSVL